MDADVVDGLLKGCATFVGVGVILVGGSCYLAGRQSESAKPQKVMMERGSSVSRLELLAEDVDRDGKPDALLSANGKRYLLRYDAASDSYSAVPYRIEIVTPAAQ